MASTEIIGIEDSYDGYEFETWDDFMAQFACYCEDDLLGRWNVPVWLDIDPDGNRVILGLLATRHGRAIQWIAPWPENPDALFDLRTRLVSVWAGRAEQQFARHPTVPGFPTHA